MTTTDHAAEARRLVALASTQHSANDAQAIASAAQVHATLHLAEQQRIANLIALARLGYLAEEALAEVGNEVAYGGLLRVTQIPATPSEGPDEQVALRPDVAATLGIEVTSGR